MKSFISKTIIFLLGVLITVILSAYILANIRENKVPTETFHYETREINYLLSSKKNIAIKLKFAWKICDAVKMKKDTKYFMKEVHRMRVFVIINDAVQMEAYKVNSFEELNTLKTNNAIIEKSREDAIKYGICIEDNELKNV